MQKQTEVNQLEVDIRRELSGLEIDFEKLISLNTDFSEINTLINSTKKKLNTARYLLGEIESEDENETLLEGYESNKGLL